MIRRPAEALPGRALVLSYTHRASDRKDAELMRVFAALRPSLTLRARLQMLAGLTRFAKE